MPPKARSSIKEGRRKKKLRFIKMSRKSHQLAKRDQFTIIAAPLERQPDVILPKIVSPMLIPEGTAHQKTSATINKLSLFGGNANLLEDETKFGYDDYATDVENVNIIINMKQLNMFVMKFNCNICNSKTLKCKLVQDRREGIVEYLYTVCSECGFEEGACPTSPRLPSKGNKGKTDFLLNKRIVSAFVTNGQSYGALDHFCGAMNMHSMSHKTFDHHASSFKDAAVTEIQNILAKSVVYVKKAYQKMDQSETLEDADVPLDICVSYDGSWRTRGHSSQHGIGIVIEVVTGLVIDYEILSTFCPICNNFLKRKNLKASDREDKKVEHQASGECQINFNGSSNAMESEAAVRMWKRSISKHNLRYVEVLSDGDAKTYSKLLEVDPYPGTKIIKDECINHIKKRMNTALRKLVAEEKSKGVTLGGRGRLSVPMITKLSNYYGKAIRDNLGDLEEMRKAVFATLFHVISTDEEPHHLRCPSSVTSWCFYQRALAKGEEPGLHKDNMKTVLSKEIAEKMKEIYQRLGDVNLLLRCIKGKTQNANESLHSKIWSFCPKVGFSGRRLLDAAVARAISEFNAGAHTLTDTFSLLNIDAGKLLSAHSTKKDRQRINQSIRRTMDSTKEARLAQKHRKILEQEVLNEQEGMLYEAGGGD